MVSLAGSRLLIDLADRATLTEELAEGLAVLRKPRARQDPGRILIDLAVAVAEGATTIFPPAANTRQRSTTILEERLTASVNHQG